MAHDGAAATIGALIAAAFLLIPELRLGALAIPLVASGAVTPGLRECTG